MKNSIKRVAVLGSGVMGCRIAFQFANIGIEVLLLDVLHTVVNEKQISLGLKSTSPAIRNYKADMALQQAILEKPLPYYSKKSTQLVSTGNFTDDMSKIYSCDWVLEAVIEDVGIKKQLLTEVDTYRKKGTWLSTNTSSIAIHVLADGKSDDFKAHFCGVHFFNPPRFLSLLEIIPSAFTLPLVINKMVDFGENRLGKNTLICKDTPGFIANRMGVFALMSICHIAQKMGINVYEIDVLTGELWGRPKSATYRTMDVIGLDTLLKIADEFKQHLKNDEANDTFNIPEFAHIMVAQNLLGDKSRQGFYKKTKTIEGANQLLALNLQTFLYENLNPSAWDNLSHYNKITNLTDKFKAFSINNDKESEFFRATFSALFAYASNRIPEIANHIYQIDAAMRNGFGWKLGPFQIWDSIGVAEGISMIEAHEKSVAIWVKNMLKNGFKSFYTTKNNQQYYYDIAKNEYEIIPFSEKNITLNALRQQHTVFSNAATNLIDIGDGVLNIEFTTKMNTINTGVLIGLNTAIDIAEKSYKALVISNEANNFSAGADLSYILKLAQNNDWETLNAFIKLLQDTFMRMRYSNIPVIAATQGMVLGGGCELCLHANFVQMYAETYMGLVEVSVGLLPAGGGCKEFVLLASDVYKGEIDSNILKNRFITIAHAKKSSSAAEAVEMGFLKEGSYAISLNKNRLLFDAKNQALKMAANYTPLQPRKNIKVLGMPALAMLNAHINNQNAGGYINEQEAIVLKNLALVMCGGDLSTPTFVSEQCILDAEREAFLSLCADARTQAKIASITSKPKN